MTLIVSTICPEGIVLVADSKCTISKQRKNPQTGDVEVTESGFVSTSDKLLLTDNNVGIGIQGIAEINDVKADLFLREYVKARAGLDAKQLAEEIKQLLISKKVDNEMQIYVAGYVQNGDVSSPRLYLIKSSPQCELKEYSNYDAYWIGECDIMDRLFELRLLKFDEKKNYSELPLYMFPFPAFNLQDAVDFSVLGVEMTYRVMRFQDRTQTVGPPIDVLAINRDGAKWYQKKEVHI